jgi:N utilization substance protein B
MSDDPRDLSAVRRLLEKRKEAPEPGPESAPAPPRLSSPKRRARTIARLAAVQALYQMETAGEGAEAVIREFGDHRFEGDIEGETLADADETYFAEIVRGVVGGQVRLDRAIGGRLAANWRLERLDATARALLRAGAWELADRADTPTEVVINEYVELARAFFEDGPEPAFVNGALDGLAREFRG